MATFGPPGPLSTVVDVELQGIPRGAELADATERRRAERAPMAIAPTRTLDRMSSELTMTWGDLQQRNPEWLGDYWAECRALYAGGARLLADQKVLERLFPKHLHEDAMVYKARKERAHYFPYPGTIIDHLLAGLGTDPLTISFAEVDDKGASTTPKKAEWWERWITDVTDDAERPSDYGLESEDEGDDEEDDEGGCNMHHFIVECLREACQTRTAWVLADLPEADPEVVIDSRLAAERSGALDPYLCLIPSEQVIDWQCDKRGHLEWALILVVEQPRNRPSDRRGLLLHTYTLWTTEMWARYEVLVDPRQPPHETTQYQPVDAQPHDFGRVPIDRLCLPEGLYAMGKLHSLAREHFNKRCAMSWAEYKSLFAILYEFHGAEDKLGLPIAEAQTDSQRAVNQIRGQGYTQVRGGDDRAEFVGPPPEAFVAARESCNDAMREMHRVMFSMALSANMDKAALQRSGESKEKDHETTAVLLAAFGTLLLRFARRLLVLASLGRGEAVPKSYMTGLDKFDVTGTSDAIAEAVEFFNGVPQQSNLVRELYLARLYADVLGDLSAEQVEQIRGEIRDSISVEEAAAAAGMMETTGGNTNAKPGAPKPGAPAKKPAPAPSGGPMYKSRPAKR